MSQIFKIVSGIVSAEKHLQYCQHDFIDYKLTSRASYAEGNKNSHARYYKCRGCKTQYINHSDKLRELYAPNKIYCFNLQCAAVCVCKCGQTARVYTMSTISKLNI